MKYRHIVSITGLGGLFQLLSTKNNGAFVKSLEDHSNKFISSRTHQVTPLESIEIYTLNDNIYLHEVFEKLKSVDAQISQLNLKDNAAVVQLFAEAVPEFDRERVYTSDIKKIFKWYALLKKNDLLDFTEYFEAQDQSEEEGAEAAETEETVEEKKPVKKAKAAKAKAASKSKEDVEEESEAEEKPKPKKVSKKKVEETDGEEETSKTVKKTKAASVKKKKTEE